MQIVQDQQQRLLPGQGMEHIDDLLKDAPLIDARLLVPSLRAVH